MVKVHIFHTGQVIVDRAIPYKEKNPLAVTGFMRGKAKKIRLPVSCYLIEHPDGKILIDTGWDSIYAHQRPNAFLDTISSPIIKENEGVDYKLKNLGIRPEDIDCVFLSHMDFDHTSGLRLVKDAKRVSASREELADSRKYFYRYVKATWKFVNVEPFEYQQTGIGPVGRSYDVFRDGSVLLVNTPGHSHGLFSVRISNGNQYAILASDTIYTQKSLRERTLPGFTVNDRLARQSLDWICGCAGDKNCLFVAANHDPAVKERIIEL